MQTSIPKHQGLPGETTGVNKPVTRSDNRDVSSITSQSVQCCSQKMREGRYFFISKKLTGAETRYRKHEKMAPALVYAVRRLKPYFQGRQIRGYTEYPLRKILQNSQESSRLAEWVSYLSAYNILFEPRKA